MPIFTVLCRVDAFVDYVVDIEADSAEDAASIAYENDQEWVQRDVVEFDDRMVVTLDEDGDEIERTKRGDF